MAAQAAAFTNYIQQTLQFPQALRAAINANGVTTFDDLQDYRQSDRQSEIDDLVKAIREPGGLIPNPNAAVAGAPAMIRNPGTQVMNHEERRLRRIAFYCFHRHYHLQSPVQPAQATLAEINRIWDFYLNYERNKDNDIPTPEKYKPNKLKETLDALDQLLSQVLGDIGLPLTYLIRDEVDPPAAAPPAQPTMEDMIRRARHNGRFYAADNKKLWDILYATFFGTDGWTWIVSFQRRTNGRGAYLAFKAHFLGGGFRNMLFKRAEASLRALHYEEEKHNFSFHTYVTGLKEGNGLVDRYGRPEDSRSQYQQVRKMIDGMSGCSNPKVLAAIAFIESSDELKNNFERASNYISMMIANQRETTRVRIAATDRRNRQNDRRRENHNRFRGGPVQGRRQHDFEFPDAPAEDNPDIDISARSYSHAEWDSLSANQRNRVLDLREDADDQSSNQDRRGQQQDRRSQQQRDQDQRSQQQRDQRRQRLREQYESRHQQNDQRNVQSQSRIVQFSDQQGPSQRQRTGEYQIQVTDPSGNQVQVASISVSVPESNAQQQQPSSNNPTNIGSRIGRRT